MLALSNSEHAANIDRAESDAFFQEADEALDLHPLLG